MKHHIYMLNIVAVSIMLNVVGIYSQQSIPTGIPQSPLKLIFTIPQESERQSFASWLEKNATKKERFEEEQYYVMSPAKIVARSGAHQQDVYFKIISSSPEIHLVEKQYTLSAQGMPENIQEREVPIKDFLTMIGNFAQSDNWFKNDLVTTPELLAARNLALNLLKKNGMNDQQIQSKAQEFISQNSAKGQVNPLDHIINFFKFLSYSQPLVMKRISVTYLVKASKGEIKVTQNQIQRMMAGTSRTETINEFFEIQPNYQGSTLEDIEQFLISHEITKINIVENIDPTSIFNRKVQGKTKILIENVQDRDVLTKAEATEEQTTKVIETMKNKIQDSLNRLEKLKQ